MLHWISYSFHRGHRHPSHTIDAIVTSTIATLALCCTYLLFSIQGGYLSLFILHPLSLVFGYLCTIAVWTRM
jgi:hypothetical protein